MIPIIPLDHPGISEGIKIVGPTLRTTLAARYSREATHRARVVCQTAIIGFLGKANPEDIKTYAPRLYDAIRNQED